MTKAIWFKAFDNPMQDIIDAIEGDVMLRRSPDSASMLDYWDLVDCIIDGADAMRGAGDKYFPKFSAEKKEAYEFRLSASKFTNIFRDICEQLSSKPFEEETSLVEGEGKTIPQPILDMMEDIDGAGSNLTAFAGTTFFNGVVSAIDWIFVDYPTVDASVIRTKLDERNANLRPFWSHVLGRNVLESRSTMIGSKEVLTYIRIFEPGKPDKVRIFERDPKGVVTWKLYAKIEVSGKVKFTLEASGVITIGVIPLVPFATGRRDGRTRKYWPVMRDAADQQRELYLQESALKFAKIMTAYPMLAANGISPERGEDGKPLPIAIGPGVVLYSPSDGQGNHGEWKYVEPSATSLTFLAGDIKETIANLRELGRLPLTAQSGNITVITAGVAASKASTAVGAWTLVLKNSLENALIITCMWLGIKDTEYSPEVNVYNDFDIVSENSADIEQLHNMRTDGDLSQETYWFELKRRRVLSPEFDQDVEAERILKEVPSDAGEDGENEDDPAKPDPNKPIKDDPLIEDKE